MTDIGVCTVDKMILKLTILLTSYISTSTKVDSYVLLAANIDDFRSFAHRIIPGKLADQISDMAGKNKVNYRFDKNKALVEEETDEFSSSDGTYYSDYSKDMTRSKNSYKLGNEHIDLDELVRRVKEKLDKEYKLAQKTKVQKKKVTNEHQNAPMIVDEPGSKIDVATSESTHTIKDYFYRDDSINGDFGKGYEEQKHKREKSPNHALITESPGNPYEEIPIYDENIEYVSQNPDEAPAYEQKSPINSKGNPMINNQNQKYKLVTLEDTEQDHVQPGRQFHEFGNVVKKNENNINIQKEFYQETDKRVSVPTSLKYEYIITEETSRFESQEGRQNEGTTEDPMYYEENLQDTVDYDNTPSTTEVAVDYANLFKEIDMLKPSNDSYEDYITPERDNIFDDDDPTTTENPKGSSKKIISDKGRLNKAVDEPEPILKIAKNNVVRPPSKPAMKQVNVATPSPLLIRAKTASMWYKEPNIANYDESKKKVIENSNGKTSKRPWKTAFPTRQRFSMSSPNYLAKMPVVAEKYNFDEPIPENDQEPENLKPIGNPPALINKKVRLD